LPLAFPPVRRYSYARRKAVGLVLVNIGMKMTHMVRWWLLSAVALLAVLLAVPVTAQAQETKRDLVLIYSPGSYLYEVKPGEDNVAYLEVRNAGTDTITNIRLSADIPENWAVTFAPSEMASLAPGDFQTVDVNIIPDRAAGRGNYQVTFVATANEMRRVMTVSLRVESVTSAWLWVGVAVAAIVIAGFVFIFIRSNRA
jgi:uncharacterized membrane protein